MQLNQRDLDVVEDLSNPENFLALHPESAFRDLILPAILNEAKNGDISFWLKLAGNYNRELGIYADGDKTKKVLFVVPAPLARTKSVEKVNGRSISEIIQSVGNMKVHNPALFEKHVQATLENSDNSIEVAYEQLNIQRWAFIFEKYNIKVEGQEDTQTKPKIKEEVNLEDDYDI